MQKNIIVVLGAPRSGTSAITRGLKALGIEIGNDLTPADSLWNPKGFWEDKDISNKINCGILTALNSPWESLSIIDSKELWVDALLPLKKLASDLLFKKMQNYSYWGFKDPRTAKLIPFWQEIFQTLQLKDYYIITLRNPLAVAFSYQKLRGFDMETAMLLWLMHTIPAIDETQKNNRMIVSFEQMLIDPQNELGKIKNFLQLENINEEEVLLYTNQFLDKNFCHYSFNLEDLKNHPVAKIVPLGVEVYELLLKISQGLIDFNSHEFMIEWQKIKIKFNINYPFYIYLDSLLKKNKRLKKELRSMQRSVTWNLSYPFRMMESKVKILLQKKRQKRRIARGSF